MKRLITFIQRNMHINFIQSRFIFACSKDLSPGVLTLNLKTCRVILRFIVENYVEMQDNKISLYQEKIQGK